MVQGWTYTVRSILLSGWTGEVPTERGLWFQRGSVSEVLAMREIEFGRMFGSIPVFVAQ